MHTLNVYRPDDDDDEDVYKMSVFFYGVDGGRYEQIFDNTDTPKQFASSLRQFATLVEQEIAHQWH